MIKQRIQELLKHMEENNFDAYIIPSSDYHQSEYVADYFKSRAYISGFTGSAGTVVITKDHGHGLWTDGRYFLQAESQLKGSDIRLFKMHQPGVLDYEDWLLENLDEQAIVGLDGRCFSVKQIEKMKKTFKNKGIKINETKDLIDDVWTDRPSLPTAEIFVHEMKYAGKSIDEKLKEIRQAMKKKYIDAYVLSSLDDIAWTFNLRGNDVTNNPVFLAYALILKNQVNLYVNDEKLTEDAVKQLKASNINIKGYNEIFSDVSDLQHQRIFYSKSRVNSYLASKISEHNEVHSGIDFTTHLKAQKNKTEVENIHNVMIKDGVAMVKFLYWLDQNIGKEVIDEVDADEKLQHFRKNQDLYQQDSFPYISGYASNGAIIHYRAEKGSCKELEAKGLYLIDSGGQYLDGTTDITRTVVLGELTEEEKSDFTVTLMGHINLARAQFLEGTYGANLDILARQPFWDRGLDYKHGTGHGVGCFLNVHEGPQNIAIPLKPVTLKEGMLISNEPGMYRSGKHGIRIENLVLVQKSEKTDFGQFYTFDTVTLCPIDQRAIDASMMTQNQIDWLNEYHDRVFEALKDSLTDEERNWLREMTKAIG